jgi:sugar phosphate isomerase/epimerase
MPKLAAFPKAFMQALCKTGNMRISEWIELASTLHIEGLEWYAGFLEMQNEKNWPDFRLQVEDKGMVIPMMCCSPDFTHPDNEFRKKEIAKQKRWIKMTHVLGGSYCRVLSGQRRPVLSDTEGVKLTVESIEACLPYAQELGITLILENHYKDDFWEYPEFAQKTDIFCQLVDAIHHPNFGVNYDPSNAFLAGEDPMDLLKRVSARVVTMHASDRFLLEGTLEDLRREEQGVQGYAKRLSHGEIGKGLNDYDAIFEELSRVKFDGWISIEDGVDGMEQLANSVAFLRNKISRYWS